jgi:uncharacterized membrane protein YhaH (DUF805 family)
MRSSFAWLFLSLNGRISREEFWLGYAAAMIILLLTQWKLTGFFLDMRRPLGRPWYREELDLAIALPTMFVLAILIWPLTAIAVKRLHDCDLSGWWLLALPVLAVIATMTATETFHGIFSSGIALVGVFRGTRGGNRFGADPLAHFQV